MGMEGQSCSRTTKRATPRSKQPSSHYEPDLLIMKFTIVAATLALPLLAVATPWGSPTTTPVKTVSGTQLRLTPVGIPNLHPSQLSPSPRQLLLLMFSRAAPALFSVAAALNNLTPEDSSAFFLASSVSSWMQLCLLELPAPRSLSSVSAVLTGKSEILEFIFA